MDEEEQTDCEFKVMQKTGNCHTTTHSLCALRVISNSHLLAHSDNLATAGVGLMHGGDEDRR